MTSLGGCTVVSAPVQFFFWLRIRFFSGDPPYHPLSKTASFTAYNKGGFGEDSQRLLANVCKQLREKGVNVLLSNSMTDFTKKLYEEFEIEEVRATRAINSRGDLRGHVSEVLVRNF